MDAGSTVVLIAVTARPIAAVRLTSVSVVCYTHFDLVQNVSTTVRERQHWNQTLLQAEFMAWQERKSIEFNIHYCGVDHQVVDCWELSSVGSRLLMRDVKHTGECDTSPL